MVPYLADPFYPTISLCVSLGLTESDGPTPGPGKTPKFVSLTALSLHY